jgi:hypothetical protein
MYQWYQIMICLLKFDFFFFSGVTIQVSPPKLCLYLNLLIQIDTLASYCGSSKGFCGIRCNYCCHTHSPVSSHLVWCGSSAGDQIVT